MTYVIMMIGMLCMGFAFVFVKFGTLHPFVLAAFRLLLAGIVLFPLFIKDLRISGKAFHFSRIVPSLLPGFILGIHFMILTTGARMIPGGHASVIITMGPVVMPFWMFLMIREKITLRELGGSILALGGALFLGLKDSSYSLSYIKGDILVFIAMILLTFYLALARKHRKDASLWFYTVPVYLTGGLVCLITSILIGADLMLHSRGDLISVGGLGLVCTVIGLSINNYGMRKLRGQIVSLLNLTQIVLATLAAFLILGEIPPVYFYPAALVILSGPLLVILFDRQVSPA
jgi:drug/metabolite transporter (DMT)-like permease